MKITLTGSIGRVGKPLTKKLIEQGHTVTVISSSRERSEEIKNLGAIPAIGDLKDVVFLAAAFKDADAVYVMVPPANYFDPNLDLLAYFTELGHTFAKAIENSNTTRVVNLSSIGAHLKEGNGILEGTYEVEQLLNELPKKITITHIRPTEIYYNLYGQMDLIKNQGILAGNLGEDNKNVWVALEDIADIVAEELTISSSGRRVRYAASDELTYKELASALGSAVGKPDLQWTKISDVQLTENLSTIGMNPRIAKQMTEMYAAIRSGLLYEDYNVNKPEKLGRVKMNDFAQEFAAIYHKE